MLKKIYDYQMSLNDKLMPDWRYELSNHDFQLAIIAETGELLESLGYKWWKKTEIDKDNILVEAIDILHFMMSKVYYVIPENMQDELFFSLEMIYNRIEVKDEDKFNKYLILEFASCDAYEVLDQFEILFKIFKWFDLKLEDIVKLYLTKNVLNSFRKENGYQDGSYRKEWNGIEDNVYAFRIVQKIPYSENFEKELYEELKKSYEGGKNDD